MLNHNLGNHHCLPHKKSKMLVRSQCKLNDKNTYFIDFTLIFDIMQGIKKKVFFKIANKIANGMIPIKRSISFKDFKSS